MYRLLLVLGLLIVLFFLLRSVIRDLLAKRGESHEITEKNHMVQDPVCRMYVPRGSAVAASIGGQTYYFCSNDCAQTFQKQLSR
jgi:YHS domain-containing protein